jgi:hypothetical protein
MDNFDLKKYLVENKHHYKMKKSELRQIIKEEIQHILYESKQVGTLYHFTDTDALLDILKSNKMFAVPRSGMGDDRDFFYVSFTRNKNMFLNKPKLYTDIEVALVLDGDMLSDKYKFEPFSSSETSKPEYEERIKIPTTSSNKNIENIKKYLKGIIILGHTKAFRESEFIAGPKAGTTETREERINNLIKDIKKYTNIPIEVIGWEKNDYPIKMSKDIKYQQDKLKSQQTLSKRNKNIKIQQKYNLS